MKHILHYFYRKSIYFYHLPPLTTFTCQLDLIRAHSEHLETFINHISYEHQIVIVVVVNAEAVIAVPDLWFLQKKKKIACTMMCVGDQ